MVPNDSEIKIIYWTEEARGKGVGGDPTEDYTYTASAVKTLTTAELTQALGESYGSGSEITLEKLSAYY